MSFLKIKQIKNAENKFSLKNISCMSYTSGVDCFDDWALLLPGSRSGLWAVILHGHGSAGDQFFSQENIMKHWFPELLETGAGIICPNLRGNAWMSPAAASDLHELISYLRVEFKMQKTVFTSGSMGATGSLVYGVLFPEDVDAIDARGAAADIGSYYSWCMGCKSPLLQEIACSIRLSYGGEPDLINEIYDRHSTLKNADKLVMPVSLIHGENDKTIPVEQARRLAERLSGQANFFYREIPGGDHNSPLFEKEGFQRVLGMLG